MTFRTATIESLRNMVQRISGELEHKPLDRQLLDRFASKSPGTWKLSAIWVVVQGMLPDICMNEVYRSSGSTCLAVMVEQARRLNPCIEFHQGNMLSLDIEDGALGGNAAFYSIIHIPRTEITLALAQMKRALRQGGLLLLAFHVGDETLHLDEWWGQRVTLDFHFFDPEEIAKSLRAVGFEIEEIVEREPYPDVEHESRRCYIFARKSELQSC